MPEIMNSPDTGVGSVRWTRTHTIWTLIVFSLLPGVFIAMYRSHWLELPAGMKAAVYLSSALLIVAVVGLIMSPRDRRIGDS